MKSWLNAAVVSVSLTALGGAYAADVFPDFRINEGAVTGGAATTILADKLTGPYVEKFIVTGLNQQNTAGTFASVAYFDLTSLSRLEGTQAVTGIGLNNSYSLFGVFTAAGTFATSGGATTFTGTAATLSLWSDGVVPDPNGGTKRTTTVTLNNNGTYTLGGNLLDDKLIASTTTFSSGSGNINAAGGAKGDFAIVFSNLLLSSIGKSYFYDPNPFYLSARASGQLDTVALSSLGAVTDLTGSVDIKFNKVPEPASIALVGAALFGLGLARRRKQV